MNESVVANIATKVDATEEVNENVVAKVRKDTEKVVHNGPVNETDLVVDEFCSNEIYNEDKTKAIPSPIAPLPRPSQGLGSFDYDSLRFEDFCDPD